MPCRPSPWLRRIRTSITSRLSRPPRRACLDLSAPVFTTATASKRKNDDDGTKLRNRPGADRRPAPLPAHCLLRWPSRPGRAACRLVYRGRPAIPSLLSCWVLALVRSRRGLSPDADDPVPHRRRVGYHDPQASRGWRKNPLSFCPWLSPAPPWA